MLHYKTEVPWISNWFGSLPGDMVVKKGSLSIFFPVASAAITGVVFSLILSGISKK